MSIKLSIIIPCYNAEPYIHELLKVLEPQITKEVQVIVIDDGSIKPLKVEYKWVKLVRQNNKGVSRARNRGLELAKGELISFVDADDLVANNFVETIINALNTKEFDYIDLSWRSLTKGIHDFKLYSDKESLSNPSACTRVFKKDFIGDTRFPESKDACEDEYFTRKLNLKKANHICITDYMYFYRTETPNSVSKRYMSNTKSCKRIVYNYNHVTKDMSHLIDEIKELDKCHEIVLMTNRNDIPELEMYCQVIVPRPIRAMELRGEKTKLVNIIPPVIKTQVIIFTSFLDEVGGIETFIYNFCYNLHKDYDIVVVYDTMGTQQIIRLQKIVQVVKNNPKADMYCDTLIMNRIFDSIPPNIHYGKSVQMLHCIKQSVTWCVPKNRDYVINVSNASKESFGKDGGQVIHNILVDEPVDKCLLLVSATRVDATDKQGNDERCRKFCKLLKDNEISFIWVYFSNKRMNNEPDGMIYGGFRLNIKPYIKKADYVVQLSGTEAYSYTMIESLQMNTPLICTPLEQNKDMHIEDGINAYIVPFEVDGFDVKKLLNVPKFEYKTDNTEIIKKWKAILGKKKPKRDYRPSTSKKVLIKKPYFDLVLNRAVEPDEIVDMTNDRVQELTDKGFVKLGFLEILG